jgi:hypothetical protein
MSNEKAEIPGSSIPSPIDDLKKIHRSRWQRKKLQVQGAQNLRLAARNIQLPACRPLESSDPIIWLFISPRQDF